MSLATRCVSCGTVFRVVQDQLKVSEGWVRCGRCEHVFNALDNLFDLERDTPPPWPGAAPSSRPGALASAPAPLTPSFTNSAAGELAPAFTASAPAPFVVAPAPDALAGPGAAPASPASPASPPADAQATGVRARGPFPWSRPAPLDASGGPQTELPSELPTEILTEVPTQILSQLPTEAGEASSPSRPADAADSDPPAPAVAAAPHPTPDFLRRAHAAERWNQPRTRIGLGLLGMLLLLVLLVQVGVHQRDPLAAHWPDAAPALQALCSALGCQVEPLRHIDGLAVESSGLTRLEGSSLHRLAVALRNRDAVALQLPWLELALTDTRGQTVARKVLSPADLGVSQPTLAPGRDVSLQALLDTGERRVAGYSIEIFYP